jgi:predicted PurR-regulated permease PerM
MFNWDHPVIVTFLTIAVVASMSLAAEVLKPLALSILLAFALAPMARFLERRGLKRVPAVVLTGIVVLGALGGVGYVVINQVEELAGELPEKRAQIERKLAGFTSGGKSKITQAQETMTDLARDLGAPKAGGSKPQDAQDVRIVAEPKFRERLEAMVGPYLEFLTVGSFVLILVLFMMVGREDLGDRIIRLFGDRRISLTTRTMAEVGDRISRYLATLTLVNAGFGVVIGGGLWLIGVPYAMTWGVIAALLRFIPYVGTTVGFALPAAYAIAHFPGWREVILFCLLYLAVETVLNSFLEPVIYGKTTGVSALGLLVAAMFWTWLWGVMGLVLSTPLTVCLAVLGKYVPSLAFFATLLGEESELEPDVRYYQRLLALDQDGATEIVEEALKARTRVEVFDKVLIPALSRAERDYARDEIDDREQALIWRVTGEVIEELEGVETIDLESVARATAAGTGPSPTASSTATVLGIAANDHGDALALAMLRQLLEPDDCALEIVTATESPLKLVEAVAEHAPSLVIFSHLPPVGLTPARYLVRRLRARMPGLPIFVGRWGEGGDAALIAERLASSGANAVVFSLAEARAKVLDATTPKTADAAAPSPALA